jgi:hypothetical protein
MKIAASKSTTFTIQAPQHFPNTPNTLFPTKKPSNLNSPIPQRLPLHIILKQHPIHPIAKRRKPHSTPLHILTLIFHSRKDQNFIFFPRQIQPITHRHHHRTTFSKLLPPSFCRLPRGISHEFDVVRCVLDRFLLSHRSTGS